MKTSFRILAACLAASLALVSCEKESTTKTDNGGETKEGVRTITMSFSTSTRSALGNDGVTPHFTSGDEIMLANEAGTTQKVTVSVSDNTATASTTLKGKLTAVYPADAYSATEPYYTVNSSQDGTFAKANICTATIPDEPDPSAEFETQVAILCFYVDTSIGVTQIEIDGTGVATGGNKITVAPASGTLYNVGGGPDPRICYAAVLPISGTDIALKGTATTQNQERPIANATLAANTIYNAFIPYYIEVGGVKWGYCNVGAFFPEDYGQYFMWGETTGHYPSATASTGVEFKNAFTGNEKGFAWYNYTAFTNGVYSGSNMKAFKKYVLKDMASTLGYNGFYDDKTTLDLENDAAYCNWGKEWRMPTKGEFDDLISKTSTSKSNVSNGILTINGHQSLIFPAAGYGDGAKLNFAGSYGYYWSSSLADSSVDAYYLSFTNTFVFTDSYSDRYSGRSVRPVSVSN